MTVVRDQLFPQKPPGSRFRFSRTGVQPSPGSSTIELPSAFSESGAYPPDREPPGSPRQCSLPLACRHPPEGHQIGARRRCTPENTILSQPYCAASQPTGRIAKAASWLHLSRVSPALLPPERPSHTHTPKPGFGGRGHEMYSTHARDDAGNKSSTGLPSCLHTRPTRLPTRNGLNLAQLLTSMKHRRTVRVSRGFAMAAAPLHRQLKETGMICIAAVLVQ